MQVGAKQTVPAEKKAKAKAETTNYFTRKQIGSDYYATNEEDPLLASSASANSFRKKKSQAGNKRTRINPSSLALADNGNEEDIVSMLEQQEQSSDQDHLATKKARHDIAVA